jgi:hypothetical protein
MIILSIVIFLIGIVLIVKSKQTDNPGGVIAGILIDIICLALTLFPITGDGAGIESMTVSNTITTASVNDPTFDNNVNVNINVNANANANATPPSETIARTTTAELIPTSINIIDLEELAMTEGVHNWNVDSDCDNFGEYYPNGGYIFNVKEIGGLSTETRSITFSTKAKYTRFTARIVLPNAEKNKNSPTYFIIHNEKEQLYVSGDKLLAGMDPIDIDIDITDSQKITIEYHIDDEWGPYTPVGPDGLTYSPATAGLVDAFFHP